MISFSFKTKHKLLAYLIATIVLYSSLLTNALAQNNSGQAKLVVYVVADQFGCNYFSWCVNKSQANGCKRLLEYGANFTACHYSGATNQTAPNLAVISTGAYPWSSGIIGNQWYDRHKQKTLKACESSMSSGEESSKTSDAHALTSTTIGDELKIASLGSNRIIALAGYEQNAMLLAGKLADKSFWWDSQTNTFAGQSHFGKDLPPFAQTFNSLHNSSQYSGKTWQPLEQESAARQSSENGSSSNKSFAHTLDGSQFVASPWANQLIFDFAKEVIDKEELGAHSSPDLLAISFSAFEAVSKNYGDYSPESLDMALRFDQSLAEFLQFLDHKIGLSNCLIVFTACRGTTPSSEFLRNNGMEAGTIEAKAFKEQLNSALCSRLGNAKWIEAFEPPNVYFNLNAIDHSNFRQPDVEKLAAKLGRSVTGTAEIYGAFQLFMNELPSGPLVESLRKSYFWGRSGELYVIPKPGFSFVSETDGTTCGSPYNYDTQVPLIISGYGTKAGVYAIPADPDDIAPTTANILGICSPALAEGHVLSECLSTQKKANFR